MSEPSERADEPDQVRQIGLDPEAFERFYRHRVGEVTRFIVRRVQDPMTAADLTADTFVQAILTADRYRGGPGGARGWLFGIARNLVADQQRRSGRVARYETKVAGRRLLDTDDIARLEEQIDAARHVAALEESLAGLNDGERAVLELVAHDGLSIAEAAAVLGIRAGTARARLHRARKAVRPLAGHPIPASAVDDEARTTTHRSRSERRRIHHEAVEPR